jgi:hypothetical protein
MKVISLGGVGGCTITQSIQLLVQDQERYPYDWMLTNQSFVIETILDNNNFINFDDETEFNNNEISVKTRDCLSVHDFSSYENYVNTRDNVKEKYNRRFHRLNQALSSNEPILFIRISNNTPTAESWIGRFESKPDDIQKWIDFIQYLEKYFTKPIFLLIITMVQTEYNEHKEKFSNEKQKYLRMYKNSHIDDYNEHIIELAKVINEVYQQVNETK